jgi:hypothetical protein
MENVALAADSQMGMAMLFDPSLETRPQSDEAVDDLRRKLANLRRLEELRAVQKEERNYVEAIERNGGTGRVVDFLWSRLNSLEMEINELQARSRFP